MMFCMSPTTLLKRPPVIWRAFFIGYGSLRIVRRQSLFFGSFLASASGARFGRFISFGASSRLSSLLRSDRWLAGGVAAARSSGRLQMFAVGEVEGEGAGEDE